MGTVNVPVYYENGAYARDHKELELFRASHMENLNCRKAIETAISKHFDGFRLNKAAVSEVLDQYGYERVSLVLAATLRNKSWDGRFSAQNKDWAATIRMPEPRPEAIYDRLDAYTVSSHPAVLDGFVSHARKEMKDRSRLSIRDELKQPAMPAMHSPLKRDEMER